MKSRNIQIVVRRANEPIVISDGYSLSSDYLAAIGPKEIPSLGVEFLSFYGKVDQLSILCPVKGRVDIRPLLDAAEDHLVPDATIHIHHGHIDSPLFDRLVSNWGCVELIGCSLGRGWWNRTTSEKKCDRLVLWSCANAPLPKSRKPGCGGWPGLETLWIYGGIWDEAFHSTCVNSYQPTPVFASNYQCLTGDQVTAFFSPSLDSLILSDVRDVSFLSNLPSGKLTDLMITGSEGTNETLEWASGLSCLRDLMFSWRESMVLDWAYLKRLPKLRSLDFSDSPCNDMDLAKILANTKLRTIHGYYSKLTDRSWYALLSEPTMRMLWVGMGMMGSEMPELPPTSKVKEIVGLNVNDEFMDYIGRIAARYPGMKTCRM